MGTTLTGTTPQDTYDSLIKVTDNGPLSGSLKTLTDGLGNDSALALSTGAARVTGTLAVTTGTISGTDAIAISAVNTNTNGTTFALNSAGTVGIMTFLTASTERMRITSAGNVGIGTSSPAVRLDVSSTGFEVAAFRSTFGQMAISFANSGTTFAQLGSGVSVTATGGAADLGFGTAGQANASIVFATGSGFTERFRITNNGVTFNGDTAAANALDDYEEGTFTLTATPSVSGSITLNVNTSSYTKIGRQVTIRAQITVGSVSSPVGSLIVLGGLPFTSLNSVAARGSGSLIYFPAVGNGSLPVNYQLQNSTEWNVILDASTISAGAEFYLSLTYFV